MKKVQLKLFLFIDFRKNLSQIFKWWNWFVVGFQHYFILTSIAITLTHFESFCPLLLKMIFLNISEIKIVTELRMDTEYDHPINRVIYLNMVIFRWMSLNSSWLGLCTLSFVIENGSIVCLVQHTILDHFHIASYSF